jgi:hypothetical protein
MTAWTTAAISATTASTFKSGGGTRARLRPPTRDGV